ALGRLYADKFGLEVICIRIGAFSPRPAKAPGDPGIWLSPRDTVQLVSKALTCEAIDFLIVYGISANRHCYYDNPGADRLGYESQDAGEQAAGVTAPRTDDAPGRSRSELLQGGSYTEQSFARRERT